MGEMPVIEVLLVEDSPTDSLLAKEALRESPLFHITHVTRLDEALTLLADRKMSVVLLDLGLPDSQGLDTLSKLHRHAPDVPVIVLTARDEEELAVHSDRKMSVVLLDLGLPDSQGLDTLSKLHRHAPDVPVIVLTARDEEELAVH